MTCPGSVFEAHRRTLPVEDVLQLTTLLDPVDVQEAQDSVFAALDESLRPIFLVRSDRFRVSSDHIDVLRFLSVQRQSL